MMKKALNNKKKLLKKKWKPPLLILHLKEKIISFKIIKLIIASRCLSLALTKAQEKEKCRY
jgi:hypothetical protein